MFGQTLQAAGNILVLALLVTPAAAGRLVTDRLGPMVRAGCAVAAFGAVAGLYLSFYYNLAAGGLIVLVISGVFLLAWVFAPRHGLVSCWAGRRAAAVTARR